MVAVFGTMTADVVHIEFRVPYPVSSLLFAVLLSGGLLELVAHRAHAFDSPHSITTARRELFYWAAVLATFAMGTALGDLAAYTLNLGFLSAGILFAVLFALPGLAHYALRINAIFAFWAAYVMTRPLGASFADWTERAAAPGDSGSATARSPPSSAILIVAGVAYLTGQPQRPGRGGRARACIRRRDGLNGRTCSGPFGRRGNPLRYYVVRSRSAM